MKDPYIQENGTLENKLGIQDYDELNEAEKDIGYVKLLNVEEATSIKCDVSLIKAIHKHIFEDIFEWAGKLRTVPIYKQEVVIPGISLEYSNPKNIEEELKTSLEKLNSYKWKNKTIDEIAKQLTEGLAKIWRVHPFRDGNTRTTLAFATIFAKQHGFEIDMSSMLSDLNRKTDEKTGRIIRPSIRDMFVLAALDEKDYPEPEHLQKVLAVAIYNGSKNKADELIKLVDGR